MKLLHSLLSTLVAAVPLAAMPHEAADTVAAHPSTTSCLTLGGYGEAVMTRNLN